MAVGLALHKALFGALRDALSVPVYDAVPQGTPYPYVTVDTSIAQNADLLVERYDERFFFINVWSEHRGQEQVLAIMGEIDAALHNKRFTLDSGSIISMSIDRAFTRRDADNVTFQGQVTVRVFTRR